MACPMARITPPGSRAGEYLAKNAYIPPNQQEGSGGAFDPAVAAAKLAAVPFYRDIAANGWMGDGPNGVRPHQVTSWQYLGKENSATLKYTDEEGEKTDVVQYDIERAAMSHGELRLQCNTARTARNM